MTVDTSTPQLVLGNLFPGDQVDVQISLSTSDPNENGEGEPIVVYSTGSFSQTIGNYFADYSFSFTATGAGESIYAYIPGADGDEFGTVDVAVNASEVKRFTQAQKDAFSELQDALQDQATYWGAGSGIVCTGLGFIGTPLATILCVSFGAAFTAAPALLATRMGALARDPADPNYMSIVQPMIPALSPGTTSDPRYVNFVAALNAVLADEEQAIGYAQACSITINRAQGALNAGSAYWEQQQLNALAGFEASLSSALNTLPGLLGALKNEALSAGIPSTTLSPGEVFSYESNLAFGGLPSDVTQALTQLGATSDEISQVTGALFAQDINAVAGTFPDDLITASLSTALLQAGVQLHSDTTPPTTTAVISGPTGNHGWYRGPVLVTLTATDPDGPGDVAATYYILDGGASVTYSTPFMVTGDVIHTLSFWSVDKSGNVEVANSLSIKIDSTPPTITASANPSALWPPDGKLVPVTVAGQISDTLSGVDPTTAVFSCADDYGKIQPTGSPTLVPNADGSYSYSVTLQLQASRNGTDLRGRHFVIAITSTDNAGNSASSSATVIVPHDQSQ